MSGIALLISCIANCPRPNAQIRFSPLPFMVLMMFCVMSAPIDAAPAEQNAIAPIPETQAPVQRPGSCKQVEERFCVGMNFDSCEIKANLPSCHCPLWNNHTTIDSIKTNYVTCEKRYFIVQKSIDLYNSIKIVDNIILLFNIFFFCVVMWFLFMHCCMRRQTIKRPSDTIDLLKGRDFSGLSVVLRLNEGSQVTRRRIVATNAGLEETKGKFLNTKYAMFPSNIVITGIEPSDQFIFPPGTVDSQVAIWLGDTKNFSSPSLEFYIEDDIHFIFELGRVEKDMVEQTVNLQRPTYFQSFQNVRPFRK
jgi:hypothetical protein